MALFVEGDTTQVKFKSFLFIRCNLCLHYFIHAWKKVNGSLDENLVENGFGEDVEQQFWWCEVMKLELR
jgi:hypothetical protein